MFRLAILAAIVVTFSGLALGDSIPPRVPELPPIDPGPEKVVAGVNQLGSMCASMEAQTIAGLPGRAGKPLVTYNEKFGFIWRVDVINPQSPMNSTRIMCWKDPDTQKLNDAVHMMFKPLAPLPS